MKHLKKFNEDTLILFNNKGDLKLGRFNVASKGISGTYNIQSTDDVNWSELLIVYHNPIRRGTEWIFVSEISLNKLSNEIKDLIFENDKKETFIRVSFKIVNDKAEIVHINPLYNRTDNGLLITSYTEKL